MLTREGLVVQKQQPQKTGQTGQQPELARHSISMLEMLHEKTTKGLDEQERKMLESILYELRMKYVIKCGPDSK